MVLKIKEKINELKKVYNDVFYLEEDMVLNVVIAITVAAKLEGDPIWLLIIGGPSSGKSELCQSLSAVPFVHSVSTLSENTFLSNMPSGNGKENSLLHRIGPQGVLIMKDYTSILSMRAEKRDVIISQMREIYDGAISKESGNGQSQSWQGKLNWIGAVTESVYLKEDESAGMGRRTINYVMPNQDRKKTTMRAVENNKDSKEKRERIQTIFNDTVMYIVENLVGKPMPDITPEFTEELVDLADFITEVRSPTERNFRGELVLVPSSEMPMRVFQMFLTLARVLILLNEGEVTDEIRGILYKIAMDSIPKQRRLALQLLAQYDKITTKGAAQILRYPTETMRVWLENVNVLGICERKNSTNGLTGPDIWVMNEPYRSMMIKYDHLERINDILADKSEEVSSSSNEINPLWAKGIASKTDDPGQIKEINERAQRNFDDF